MNRIVSLNTNATLTMSSREIAELTGKRHDHVMRDIKVMLEDLGEAVPKFGGCYVGADRTTRPCFHLPKRETMILVSGYSVTLRARIIDRWMELEAAAAQPQPAEPAIPALSIPSRLPVRGRHSHQYREKRRVSMTTR